MFLGPLSQVIYGPLALKATGEDLLGLLIVPQALVPLWVVGVPQA